MKRNVYFVTGIDTNAGKSYATGYIARLWNSEGRRTITQKLIQTGNAGYSEDITLHRRIMGIDYTEEDRAGYTMPEIFSYPASPHLASRLDNRPVDFRKIEEATGILSDRYDRVLLEGAGGLMVPLAEDYLTIDYIREKDYPVIFVTSGKLGSINHTLLSLEAIRNRGIRLEMVVYNRYPETDDQIIGRDTERYIRRYLNRHFPDAGFMEMPRFALSR
ncbi:MAG: dethiobiotin synthase [Tannerellaceae bacterium]|jgi:dethiobiotin synthetase|nr:dethiobiotin synthase [Tannerellaceae bacterium]